MNIYENQDLAALLAGNTYPGRGIVLGQTPDGKTAVTAYFIMGRSENSRNRVFVKEPDGIRTEAHDPAKLADPSLIIYHPVRQMGRGLIVTNGDQTDTIRDFLEKGLPMEQALRTRAFEPDGPNWTPHLRPAQPRRQLQDVHSESADAAGSGCARYTFEYLGLAGGGAFPAHLRLRRGPHPHLPGRTERVAIPPGSLEEFARLLWDNLNEANKISLYVRFTDLASGACQETIVNKHH